MGEEQGTAHCPARFPGTLSRENRKSLPRSVTGWWIAAFETHLGNLSGGRGGRGGLGGEPAGEGCAQGWGDALGNGGQGSGHGGGGAGGLGHAAGRAEGLTERHGFLQKKANTLGGRQAAICSARKVESEQ